MDGSTSSEGLRSKVAVYFLVSFRQLCLVTVCLPLGALLVCFITAYIFQYDEVHETHCRVYNVIPSISAITGVSPQRYLWRVCVALHVGPRLLIASVYHSYYAATLADTDASLHSSQLRLSGCSLLTLCYWLNIIEVCALCGVTYISNRENYPVHEKIFIVFMLCSLMHMLATLRVFRLTHPAMMPHERTSYRLKKALFAASVASTLGLLLFFAKHRLLCHDMAFSWFALCEYVIACTNMAFHITVVVDFPTEQLIVVKGINLRQQNNWKLD